LEVNCPECQQLKEALVDATEQYVKFEGTNRTDAGKEIRKESQRLLERMNDARRTLLAHQQQRAA